MVSGELSRAFVIFTAFTGATCCLPVLNTIASSIVVSEERGRMIDARLDAVNTFPSLPETQRKVAELDDLDPPKQWAEAIDPDVPTRTVILRLLNSARYGFRSRVETI